MRHKLSAVIIGISVLCTPMGRVFAQEDSVGMVPKTNVIMQMNYCITTLSNIIHNQSMQVFQHETDQLLNNLTMEQIVGLYEINNFRLGLLDAISRFEITEEERNLLKRIQSIKRDNAKWEALSSALGSTMLLTGGSTQNVNLQMAFQALVTVARTAVEYQSLQNQQNIEELRAMWELRKEDMKTITDLRKTALEIVFNLYNKYDLKEEDRLTENLANQFSEYITMPDPAHRARLLEDNRAAFEKLASYYYYLGMAYVDMGQYRRAKSYLQTYQEMYSRNPILRYDEKTGCIALTRLAYEPTLTPEEKRTLVETALTNLPHNSAAQLQCAMVYIYELHEVQRGLQLIRSGLDDPNASDKDVLYLAAIELFPLISRYAALNEQIHGSFQRAEALQLDTYLTYLVNYHTNAWESFSGLFRFEKISRRPWLIGARQLNPKMRILMPGRLTYQAGTMAVYIEYHDGDKVKIRQLRANLEQEVPLKKVNKVDCFKANPNLKYLFMETYVPDKVFLVKHNINTGEVMSGQYPRLSEYVLTTDDLEDIVDFCEDYAPTTRDNKFQCRKWREYKKKLKYDDFSVKFKGGELLYTPHHSERQSGYYLRMVFSNGIQIMYKFDKSAKKLLPYLYVDSSNRIVFADKRWQTEYLDVAEPEEPGWWSRLWDKVAGWFK